MLVALDVDYRVDRVVAAGIGFSAWSDATALAEHVVTSLGPPAEYQPGEFYRRELPHLRSVLAAFTEAIDGIIVDGYVWLGPERPGLGAHLWEALGRSVPVVGVAKTEFAGATASEVLRGDSARPLFVTAAGIDVREVAAHVRAMHGEHRIPTLLRRVDHLARGLD